jgi:acyl dehydratase
MMMRLFADHFLSPASSIASPGLDELRWRLPVRPGDRLSLRLTVLEARRSRSKPEQGVIRSLVEVLNQHGEVVMSLKPISLIRCRPLQNRAASHP